jgi:hypothetical protein
MPRCLIPDPITGRACGRPTTRASGVGLSAFNCRYHLQRRSRHGSHWHKGYRARDLKPHLGDAIAVVNATRFDPHTVTCLARLQELLSNAPLTEMVTRLRGRPPFERALQALARLRDRGITPERLLAIHLAVSNLIEVDPGSHRIQEFRIVQIAKAAHRLAAGTHKVWDVRDEAGRLVQRTELHSFSRSSGRMLRELGEMLEEACEEFTYRHLVTGLGQQRSPLAAAGRLPDVARAKSAS